MSYSDIAGHRSMVFDGLRNAAYVRAMENIVHADSTVMDLGAGVGILGLQAARLGAGQVHLVEPSAALDAASKVAADNGLDNTRCHKCRVEDLELPGQVDIIVSVFTGNFLLTEDLLPSLFYARDKFLAPGGKMLPDRARMEVVPVCAPAYYDKYIDVWGHYPQHAMKYNIASLDFSAIRSFASNDLLYDARDSFDARPLADPCELMALDFMTAVSADCDNRIEIELNQDGTCHGWLGWFQMRLGDQWLSTSGEPQATHWSPVLLPLEKPIAVQAGEHIAFTLKRPEYGEWAWTTDYAGQRQRQSTFLSQPMTPARLRRSSDTYQPRLSGRGELARQILSRMDGKITVQQMAADIHAGHGALFASPAEALQWVKDLAGQYS